MKLVFTLVWYPWTESVRGEARTEGQFKRLRREVDEDFTRLPAMGETIFFDDGAAVKVEAVGWELDGMPYLYLGKRYEKSGESLEEWTARGFEEALEKKKA